MIDKEGWDGRTGSKDSKVMWVLKALLASYIVTGILLLLLTMALYKMGEREDGIGGDRSIYVMATLIGGILIGKMAKVKQFIWGLGLGVAYFALLLLITLGVYHTLNGDGANLVTTFILCAGGGMAGGMIS